jgi:hypothetical protein
MFVLVAGAAAGAITTWVLTRSAAPSVGLMVPADATFYAAAEVHPSGAEALALSGVLSSFPALATPALRDQVIDTLLDGALKDTGLTHADVLPWVGQEIGVSLGAGASTLASAKQSMAAYVDTSDAARTSAALNTARTSGAGGRFTFSDLEYRGVGITQATPIAPGGQGGAYALVGDVLVLAGSVSYLEDIVDTAQGLQPSLADATDYTTATGQLPSDRLATLYVDVPSALSALRTALASTGSALQPVLDQLTAFRGAAAGVEASTGGLSVDWVVDDDGSQLSAAQSQALTAAPDRNSTVRGTPADAALFAGVSDFPAIAAAVLGSLSTSLPAGASLVIQGALSDLGGDAGIEIDSAVSGGPGGAAIIATADAAAAGRFLDTAIPMLASRGTASGSSVGHTTHDGIEFSQLQGSAAGIAWTVTHGVAIIATSTAQMEAVLDTVDGGSSLGASADYARTAGAQASNAVVYVNAGQVMAALGGALSKAPGGSQLVTNLGTIESLSMTVTSTSDQVSGHILIEVP